MEIILGLFVFILGLCVGSFVNMLVYRTAVSYGLKKNKPKVKEEKFSYCDYCGERLKVWENIPVVSWLLQGGKTRCCRKKLPLTYPIVELLTGFLFLGQFNISSLIPGELFLSFLIITFMVFSAVFDFYYMVLPDFSTLILFLSAVVLNFVNGSLFVGPTEYLWTTVGAAGFLGILNVLTRGKGMGLGDVKLAFFMGVLLGWPKIVVGSYGAFIFGAVVGLYLMARGRVRRKTLVPFGPFLLLGTLIAWWFGDFVIDLFRQWIG